MSTPAGRLHSRHPCCKRMLQTRTLHAAGCTSTFNVACTQSTPRAAGLMLHSQPFQIQAVRATSTLQAAARFTPHLPQTWLSVLQGIHSFHMLQVAHLFKCCRGRTFLSHIAGRSSIGHVAGLTYSSKVISNTTIIFSMSTRSSSASQAFTWQLGESCVSQ